MKPSCFPTKSLPRSSLQTAVKGNCSNVVSISPATQTVKPDKGIGLYWQLYKALAAFRMAVRQEKQRGGGFSYDWIIRARFDVAWIRPLPSLRSFSRDSVWFNRHFW